MNLQHKPPLQSIVLINAIPVGGMCDICVHVYVPLTAPTNFNVLGDFSNYSVSTNLVTNGGFEAGNTGFTSNYTNNCSVGQGNYCVTTAAAPSNGGTWNGGANNGSHYMWLQGSTSSNNKFWCESSIPVAINTT